MAGNKRAGLRLTNRRRVLQELFNHEATSRAEIASRLNLNKSTVSSLYNELQAEGFFATSDLYDQTRQFNGQ